MMSTLLLSFLLLTHTSSSPLPSPGLAPLPHPGCAEYSHQTIPSCTYGLTTNMCGRDVCLKGPGQMCGGRQDAKLFLLGFILKKVHKWSDDSTHISVAIQPSTLYHQISPQFLHDCLFTQSVQEWIENQLNSLRCTSNILSVKRSVTQNKLNALITNVSCITWINPTFKLINFQLNSIKLNSTE